MTVSRRHLALVYTLLGVLALVFTFSHITEYVGRGFADATAAFWTEGLTGGTGAKQFLVVDLMFFAFAANIWMLFEARRLRIPFVWAYVIGGVLVAISLTFPLFLAARERRLANVGEPRAELVRQDVPGLGLLSLGSVGAIIVSMGWIAP